MGLVRSLLHVRLAYHCCSFVCAYFLQAIGQSGMTVLEELIDAALNVCEKSRQTALQQQTHTHSRSAVVLTSTGKTYTGCDVHIASASGVPSESHGVSAERAAILAAVADGAGKFDVSYFLNICVFSMRDIWLLGFVPLSFDSLLLIFSCACVSLLQCIVICSDTMKSFPAPDGLSREFMRSFGVYPVVLVNCNLEIK